MKYYIITGEPSGDIHAANLVNELNKKDPKSNVRAWGGERLISEKVSLAKNIKETSFMGIWSVMLNLATISSNLKFCKEDILNFQPDALILVDYPGFNLKIAEFAKRNHIKVFYYIPPKLWAWNKKRIRKIKKFIDHLLVIFPFEVEFYKENGIEANYVGNPVLDEIKRTKDKFTLKTSKPIIALLPGSRKEEIKLILPEMLTLVDNYPNYTFVIAATNMFEEEYYQSFIKSENVKLLFNETSGLLLNSEVALVASGTATLEAALLKTPQIVCYKTNWITYLFAKLLVKIKYISLVNIILNKEVIKELIQSRLNKKNLKKELDLLLFQKKNVLAEYARLIQALKKETPSRNAAKTIIESI